MATSKQPPIKSPKPATRNKVAGVGVSGKRKTDWQAVERDYRTGKFTLRELADKFGISHQAIAKAAKKNEWTQDLAQAIKQATNAKLVANLVDKEVAKSGQAVANTVQAAAEVNTRVILNHRRGLNRLTEVKRKLLDQIEQAAENMADLAEVIQMVRSPDDNGMDRANDALKKAMGRSALVDDLKKLADVDERVRKGEREAFGLDDGPADDESKASRMTDAERAVRLFNIMNGIGE